MSVITDLPLPAIYDTTKVVDYGRWLKYEDIATAALEFRHQHGLKAVATDRKKVGVLFIDVQETFCNPDGELFVGGAVEDAQRSAEFIYRNLGIITGLNFTLDTHLAYEVFHAPFLINDAGQNPPPFTMVSHEDVRKGVWKASPFMASALNVNLMAAQQQLKHYTGELEKSGRYALLVWPFHAMFGGKGHSLVSGLEEAAFFHAIARGAQTHLEVKGTNPWTENYSVLGPEVRALFNGTPVPRNTGFIDKLLEYDYLAIGGQAKSHCVAWTIEDLLNEILAKDPELARKVYLLEDCTSPVITPAMDFTNEGNAAFDRFRGAGMHVVQSTDPIQSWDGIEL
jgi:nicotinamidase-related amidase